jgi:hypothetical protein
MLTLEIDLVIFDLPENYRMVLKYLPNDLNVQVIYLRVKINSFDSARHRTFFSRAAVVRLGPHAVGMISRKFS